LNLSEKSFRELGVRAEIAQALAARDIHTPFAVQALVLPDALAGQDLLAKSPTGSGKTLAFAIPTSSGRSPPPPT
jgi:superfamily II DNA/RNA helicase